MISPTSRSYPYIAVAQHFNVPYRLVLVIADDLDKGADKTIWIDGLASPWQAAAVMAWCREQSRREQETSE